MADPAPGHPVRHDLRSPVLTERKPYLDALRGAAVVIMVVAHVTDAWTREADRHDGRYFNQVFLNGLAAPMFLLLAGMAVAMAAESRSRRIGVAAAARSVQIRGWQVFGLAFLFRVQSQLLGWGPFINLLKVDILNVMGPAMVAAGWLWQIGASRITRITIYAVATAACTFLTPVLREAAWVDLLPGPLEWYLRPVPGRTTFTLFPWAGFLMAGALAGELLDGARTRESERRLHLGLAIGALVAIAGGYAASFQPSIYPAAQFWTSSPTFFFIRLGLVTAAIPIAWLFNLSWGPLVTMGRSSLFVYWIHVEMAYGGIAIALKRRLPWEWSIAGATALCVLLYLLVRWKNRLMEHRTLTPPFTVLAPILK
jgi:uncharacterized membrane protein